MPVAIVQHYLNELRQVATGPSATEASYGPALKVLVEALATHLNRPLANLILQPGHVTAVGAPDGSAYGPTADELIGYLEAKDLGKDLDNLTGHDLHQFNRYRLAFPAWILTNYLQFRLFQDGQEVEHVTLCERSQILGSTNMHSVANKKAAELASLFDRFLQLSIPRLSDPERLAHLLANKARLLESVLVSLLGKDPPNAQLTSQLEAYRKWLIPDLTSAWFADLHAQTLTYGLFFAAFENSQLAAPMPFTRSNLLALMPSGVRPVRAIFQLLAAQFLPDELNWILDDLMRLLERADMKGVAVQLGASRDPTVHFYETFLSQYDPELREMRGVYYTPDEVVSYIVRSVDQLLCERFAKADGLANPDVTLLDPALGTGTFLAHSLRQVAERFGTAHAGDLPDHLRQHTLAKWYGFELLAAPYVLAHLKLGQVLESLNVTDATPQIYLTNTLSEHDFPPTLPGPFEQVISEDGKAAQRVKGKEKILVVLGNPPYSGTSYNIYSKVDDYRVPQERARNWLQNDYVKFLRWAEWKIAETENAGYQHGIVAFITDHSYLRAPSFRGMRKHLLEHFSHIYILNLHGNSRVGEPIPTDIDKDENVFDIQQGTAIAVFVREVEYKENAQLFYADLWGRRLAKYDYLVANDVTTTPWINLKPEPPLYLFAPREAPALAKEYHAWPSLTTLMPMFSQAIVTARDHFVYDFDKQSLRERLLAFADARLREEELGQQFHIHNTREFSIARAHGALSKDFRSDRLLIATYRPFDHRWLYYSEDVVEWPRKQVVGQLLETDNLAVIAFRHTRRPTPMRTFVSRYVVDARLLSSESNCFVFPLYKHTPAVVPSGQTAMGFTTGVYREPNLPCSLVPNLEGEYGEKVTPEQVLDYVYGVLNTRDYQKEFETLLQEDFPHIPFTADYDAFAGMAERGKRLKELHLLEAADLKGLANLTVGYPVDGSHRIERNYPRYDPMAKRVHINETQYFQDIGQSMWDYRVGSYNPLEQWLSCRQSRVLNADDRLQYETIATAIAKAVTELPLLDTAWQAVRSGGWFDPLTQTA